MELLRTNASGPVENVFRYRTNVLLNTQDSIDENFFAEVGERMVREIPDRPCLLLDQEVNDIMWNHYTFDSRQFSENC